MTQCPLWNVIFILVSILSTGLRYWFGNLPCLVTNFHSLFTNIAVIPLEVYLCHILTSWVTQTFTSPLGAIKLTLLPNWTLISCLQYMKK